MEFTPRFDCFTCGGSGKMKLDPDRPAWPNNEVPCVLCWFGAHDLCHVHGLAAPCALCAVAVAALAEGRAVRLDLVPVLSW